MKNMIMEKLVLGAMLPVLFAFAAFASEPGPWLVADYDRDGEIGGNDGTMTLVEGRPVGVCSWTWHGGMTKIVIDEKTMARDR